MKNALRLLILAVILAAIPTYAQTTTAQTILSSAVAQGATQITVASTTGMSASTQTQTWNLWVDGELMKITGVNSTTGVVNVIRGDGGTRANSHPANAVVFSGPAGASTNGIGNPFTNTPPTPGAACTATQYQYLPIIVYGDPRVTPQQGSVYNCTGTSTGNSRWVAYKFELWALGHPVTNVSDAAYSATLADEFINYSDISTGRTVTLPAITGVVGKTIVIKNSTANASTITVAASANQGVGTIGNTTSSVAGAGAVGRFISIVTSAGGYSWATW